MSVTSGFFNSLNGDRRYTAEQFSELINTLINDGIFANVGTAFAVTATGGSGITVGIGRAWFHSAWVLNDPQLPMTVRDAEVLQDRIDAVVIEVNHSEAVRDGLIRFVNGIPAATPARPELTKTDEISQYPLAYIYRKAGVNDVSQADITNMIGTSECPYITGILKTQDIDKIVAQWESEFNTWFDGIQNVLDEDAAAKLALQIIELESKFAALAKDGSVYGPLQDSDGNAIQDNNGTDIQARTRFALAGEGGSGGGSGSGSWSPDHIGPSDVFKVGDMVITARNDLGQNWLLCNGADLPREEYPELSPMFPPSPTAGYTVDETIAFDRDVPENPNRVRIANGRYFVLGTTGNNPCIWFKKFEDQTWTKKIIDATVTIAAARDIIYDNGVYAVLISTNSTDSSRKLYIYTSTNFVTWTRRFNSTSGQATTLKKVGNYYFAFGYGRSGGEYFVTTSLTSTTWTYNYGVIGSVNFAIRDIAYDPTSGMYFFALYLYGNAGRISRMSDPVSMADNIEVVNVGESDKPISLIITEDGHVASLIGKQDEGRPYINVYENLSTSTGALDTVVLDAVVFPFFGVSTSDRQSSQIVYENGRYYVVLNEYVYSSKNIEGPYVNHDVDTILNDISIHGYMSLVLRARQTDSYITYYDYSIKYTRPSVIELPAIAISDSAYTYIKAKE